MISANCYCGLLIFMAIACSAGMAYRNIRFSRTDDDKDHALGRPVEKDPTNSIYFMMAEDALKQYEDETRKKSHHVVLKVNKVTEQVVEGTSTRIDFLASSTLCPNDSSEKTPLVCQVSNIKNILKCHSETWSRPWLNQNQIKIDCETLLQSEN
ncbi:cystatin cpi-1-like [Danaus plexippus]|uniref:cystatin cpi-1-like n=1 Tax=Danaus plexippus TaxID=13037 RepID=UPI002AB0E438|nr:cystatin cpi-1-like [Danaus plexippus]